MDAVAARLVRFDSGGVDTGVAEKYALDAGQQGKGRCESQLCLASRIKTIRLQGWWPGENVDVGFRSHTRCALGGHSIGATFEISNVRMELT